MLAALLSATPCQSLAIWLVPNEEASRSTCCVGTQSWRAPFDYLCIKGNDTLEMAEQTEA
jgi:hypothetical protein